MMIDDNDETSIYHLHHPPSCHRWNNDPTYFVNQSERRRRQQQHPPSPPPPPPPPTGSDWTTTTTATAVATVNTKTNTTVTHHSIDDTKCGGVATDRSSSSSSISSRTRQCRTVGRLVILPALLLLLLLLLVVLVLITVIISSALFQSSSSSISTSSSSSYYYSNTGTTATTTGIRVAFIGNSITFANDLPRLMEALSLSSSVKHPTTTTALQQNSCLHSSLSFVSILSKGNGMYNKWKTSNAVFHEINTTTTATTDNNTGNERIIYDFGACTVRQLLFGHDKYLYAGNTNHHYINDGMNPCFDNDDTTYYDYLTNHLYYDYNPNHFNNNNNTNEQRQRMHWDYIVMNDQTVQPGIPQRRKRSLRALRRVYAKLFNRTKTAIPILLSTYGYDKSLYDDDDDGNDQASDYELNDDDNVDANTNSNMNNNNMDDDSTTYVSSDVDEYSNTSSSNNNSMNNNDDRVSTVYDALGDIPEFTSRIWYGYQLYSQALGQLLPSSQQPIIVPSALAFLLIHEENYNAWLQLFYDDGFHPSPHGTYLLGCCLYATIYQQMPLSPTSSSSSSNWYGLFSWFRRFTNNKNIDIDDTSPIEALYKNARLMHTESMGNDRPYPTVQEALYLYNIAERVVLQKHVPVTLIPFETIAQMEADELNN